MAASLITALFLFFCLLQSASADPQTHNVTAHPGQTANLPCKAPKNVNILIVEWIRSDPDAKKCVVLYRDGHIVKADQDPSYENRVQLKFYKMESGNLSLILENVTSKDEGTYKCLYVEERGGRRKRSAIDGEPSSIIQLKVTGPTDGDSEGGKHKEDEKDKHQHLGVILPVPVIAVVGLVGFAFKKRKGRSENKSDLPVDDPDVL
ncbi:selection and upkeep of intraepithelial T-cells protein 7-like [Scomber scombrus]|uniref:Selection and upkeep of intraepithelial T-cells protein 7-like n=1 Tax=Scomber scombrus TaxID=13677 RepID=A0AAV1QHQ8_SCOSC